MLTYFNFSFTFTAILHQGIHLSIAYTSASTLFLSAVLTLPYGHLHNMDTFLLQTVDKQGE